jgi:hypothetical protein
MFANIFVEKCLTGTSSSETGNFVFEISKSCQVDILTISSVGFQTLKIAFTTLKTTEINKIHLQPSVFSLNSITILSEQKSLALEMVENAIAFAPKNFSETSYESTGFYEEAIKVDGDCAGLMQTEMDFHHEAYNPKHSNKKYRYLATQWYQYTNSRKTNYSITHDRNGFARTPNTQNLLRYSFDVVQRSI